MDKLEKRLKEFLEQKRVKLANEYNLKPEQVKFDPNDMAELEKIIR